MEENISTASAQPAAVLTALTGDGNGSTLYVINLCASIAPVPMDGRNLPGLDNYRLYQVARVEDGRTRHRLRLGFFTSEAHADSVLTIVRQQYPTAFTTSLSDEDRKFARGFLPTQAAPLRRTPRPTLVPASPGSATAPAATRVTPDSASTPAAARTPLPAEPQPMQLGGEASSAATATGSIATSAAPAQLSTAADAERPVLSLSDPPPLPQIEPAKPPQPFHVANGIEIGDLGISLQPEAEAVSSMAGPAGAQAAKLSSSAAAAASLLDVAADGASAGPRTANARPAAGHAAISRRADRPAASAELAAPRSQAAKQAPSAPQRGASAAAPSARLVTGRAVPPASRLAAAPAPLDAATVTHMPAATARSSVRPSAPQPASARRPAPPELDSTQTIRALTSAELAEDNGEKWFAIQLAASEQPVNLETMPHLDIFEAYRLYSVAMTDSGKIVHSLRLGFFREAVSAEAVCGYLRTFFGSPTILRVSVAEHARFKEPPKRRQTAGEAAPVEANVVELRSARTTPRPAIPTVTMEVSHPPMRHDGGPTDQGATGSFNPNATGSFRPNATGSHQVPSRTTQPAMKPSAHTLKRSEPPGRGKRDLTGKQKLRSSKKTLAEQLLEEAREVELSESGMRKLPKNDSLLSRLVGKLTK